MSENLDPHETITLSSDDGLAAALSSTAPVLSISSSAPPVPPASPTLRYRRHGLPSAIWTYRDSEGSVLCCVARYKQEGGGKQIVPWVRSDLTGEWIAKGPPSPRPLFNLDQLAARPEAPVVVVEGEKAAVGLDGFGGAAALLPGSVVTTSMGGARAARKTDWSPLAHREVVIWRDADEPGAAYAQEVAELALAAGATSVGIVDVADLPKGFDLADELPDGVDAEERMLSARLVEAPSPAAADELTYASFGRYQMDDDGLHVTKQGQDPLWISTAFEIVGRGRDPRGMTGGACCVGTTRMGANTRSSFVMRLSTVTSLLWRVISPAVACASPRPRRPARSLPPIRTKSVSTSA